MRPLIHVRTNGPKCTPLSERAKAEIKSIVKVNADHQARNWRNIPNSTNAERNAVLLLTRDILNKLLKYRQSPATSTP